MKRVNTFIAPEILARLGVNTRISSILADHLPSEFSGHIECIGLDNKTLNLSTDSAAISNRLRFIGDSIREHLRANGEYGIEQIKITTRASSHSSQKPRPTGRCIPLSATTQRLIASTARDIDDQRLREALVKLVKLNED